ARPGGISTVHYGCGTYLGGCFPPPAADQGSLERSTRFPYRQKGMETRADYYTETGKYRGGFPMYDDEFQLYECTAAAVLLLLLLLLPTVMPLLPTARRRGTRRCAWLG
ncbi:unnamed protein product, partial [Laminaria digitata]